MRGLLGLGMQGEGPSLEREVRARPQRSKKAWVRSLHCILQALEVPKGVIAGEGQIFSS